MKRLTVGLLLLLLGGIAQEYPTQQQQTALSLYGQSCIKQSNFSERGGFSAALTAMRSLEQRLGQTFIWRVDRPKGVSHLRYYSPPEARPRVLVDSYISYSHPWTTSVFFCQVDNE